MTEYAVYTARNPKAAVQDWKTRLLTWDEFLTWFEPDRLLLRSDKKKAVIPGYVLGSFHHDGRRSSENVRSRWALTLDADQAADQTLPDRVKALGVESLVHTTYQHTPDAPRYRIIIPLSREVSPKEYADLADAVMARLGPTEFDKSCNEPARFMYPPVAPSPEVYQHWHFEGDPLLVADWIEDDLDSSLSKLMDAATRPDRVDLLLKSLEKHGSVVLQHKDNEWFANCPAHDDGSPSLHITWNPETEKVVLKDMGSGQCTYDDILTAVGLTPADMAPITLPEVDFAEPEGGWKPSVLSGQSHIAERFAAYARGQLIDVGSRGWYAWDGVRWVGGTEARVRAGRLLREVLVLSMVQAVTVDDKGLKKKLQADVRAAMSYPAQRGILSIAAESEELHVEDTDPDPYLLNCKNGTLDLRTGLMHPHDPADLITAVAGAEYHPDARSSRWEHFLETSLPDPEVRDFLRRYVGQALIGQVEEQAMVIATGKTRAGKGVFTRAIKAALGEYAGTANSDLLVAGRSLEKKSAGDLSALMALRGLRWVEMSELQEGARHNEALLKTLTGNDTIRAKFMGKDTEEFRPSHSFFMTTNHLPAMSVSDVAAWARVKVVPFEISFVGHEDRSLDQDLSLQREAILAWAVHGLDEYRVVGLSEPKVVRDAERQYREEANPLNGWIKDWCELDPRAWTSAQELYNSYDQWAAEARVLRPLGKRGRGSFGEVLLATYPDIVLRAKNNVRGYAGIAIANGAADAAEEAKEDFK